jgi:hypothetical protein
MTSEQLDELGRPISIGFDSVTVHADMSRRQIPGGWLVRTWCGKGNYVVAGMSESKYLGAPTCSRCKSHVDSCTYSDVP